MAINFFYYFYVKQSETKLERNKMSLFSSFEKVVKSPISRFDGWQLVGAHTRTPDARTTEQLLSNIEYYAQKNPEVAKFKNELKAMNPKHLGLVSDICELANRRDMLSNSINLKDPKQVGRNIFASWMEKLPKASKENPEALEFTKEVINQTDTSASKYFLASAVNMLDHPEIAETLRATKPMIKNIAEETLSGGKLADFSKESRFVGMIGDYINPASDPEKIRMMQEILDVAEKTPDNMNIYLNEADFIHSKVPVAKIKENLQVFPEVTEMLSNAGKDKINMTDFLMKNVNLD